LQVGWVVDSLSVVSYVFIDLILLALEFRQGLLLFVLADELVCADLHKRVLDTGAGKVLYAPHVFWSVKSTSCAVRTSCVRSCRGLIRLPRYVSGLRLVVWTVVVSHSILIALSLLLLVFEVRMLLLVLSAVTIGH
jgi:hypothetical protein